MLYKTWSDNDKTDNDNNYHYTVVDFCDEYRADQNPRDRVLQVFIAIASLDDRNRYLASLCINIWIFAMIDTVPK